MVKKFKKPSGYIVKYDSDVHSKEYLNSLEEKFEEMKEKKEKKEKPKVKAKSKAKKVEK